jgi:hypothetical protein
VHLPQMLLGSAEGSDNPAKSKWLDGSGRHGGES